jgi:hypothetical protein
VEYVRFQGKGLTRTGDHAGIFGLVNVMGRNGMLTPGEEKFWRENNTWYSAACPDPGQIDPGVFDRAVNPHAAAWFKASVMVGSDNDYGQRRKQSHRARLGHIRQGTETDAPRHGGHRRGA